MIDVVLRPLIIPCLVSALLIDTVQKSLDGHLDSALRDEVLTALFNLFSSQESPDYVSLVQVCFQRHV